VPQNTPDRLHIHALRISLALCLQNVPAVFAYQSKETGVLTTMSPLIFSLRASLVIPSVFMPSSLHSYTVLLAALPRRK